MLIAIRIDVVVVVIDKVDEMLSFIHFVGMPIAPCFKRVKNINFETWVIDSHDRLKKDHLGLEPERAEKSSSL